MRQMLEGMRPDSPAVLAKLKGYMGLAVRARQGIFGMDACINAIRNGEAALLLLDEAISPGSMEKYEAAMHQQLVDYAFLPAGCLGDATGKPGVAMVLRSGGFADAMSALLKQQPAE